jgi:hypothetical protein
MSAVWQQYEEAVTGHFNAMLVKICSIFDSETSKLTGMGRFEGFRYYANSWYREQQASTEYYQNSNFKFGTSSLLHQGLGS